MHNNTIFALTVQTACINLHIMRFSEAWAWVTSEAVPSRLPTHIEPYDLMHERKTRRKEWGLDADLPREEPEKKTRSEILRSNLDADTRSIMDNWLSPNTHGDNL